MATVTRSPRVIRPVVDQVGEGVVEECVQLGVGGIGSRGEARLAAAFLGEAGAARVGNPDLHRAKARVAQGVAGFRTRCLLAWP